MDRMPINIPKDPLANIGKTAKVAGTMNYAKLGRKKIGRNDPCPCGSGRKYKKCCLNGRRPTPQRQRVPPRPRSAQNAGDFTPLTEPQFENQDAAASMRRAGVKEKIIYAFLRTGRFIEPSAREMYDEQTLAEWDAAIKEYEDDHGQDDDRLVHRTEQGDGAADGEEGPGAGTEAGSDDPVPDPPDTPAGESAREE